jgi:mannose-1-phosphate guanylyltransferase
MKAMILAAGGATKLYPLTYSLPKPLVPVLNIPVIEHIVELLARHGFDEVMINLHYLDRLITDQLGDGSRFGVRIHYSYEPELLGTAGGVKNVAEFFTETFLVIGADDLTDLDLTTMLEFHRQKQALASVAVVPIQTTSDVGVLELDEQNKVTWYLEKPEPGGGTVGNWGNTGVYFFEPEIFEHIPAKSVYDFGRNLFPELVRQRLAFYGYQIKSSSFWMDIGTHMSYREAHWQLLEGRSGMRVPGEEVKPHVWVGEGAVVSPQAYLRPPVLIGPGARVEAGAEINGPVVLGANTVVKEGAKVRRSVIWENCTLGNGSSLDDCLVGSGCLLQSGRSFTKIVIASGARMVGEQRESSD